MSKSKFNEEQFWMVIMWTIPIVTSLSIETSTKESSFSNLYFAVIGGLIGFSTYTITKNKSRLIKSISSFSLFGLCIIAAFLLKKPISDEDLINKEWHTQQIEELEFDSPFILEEEKDFSKFENLSNDIQSFYKDETYGRLTLFFKTKNDFDNLNSEEIFSDLMFEILESNKILNEQIDLDIIEEQDFMYSSQFSFDHNGKKNIGYGFVWIEDETIESLWLIPGERNFTTEYIEIFSFGIVPK